MRTKTKLLLTGAFLLIFVFSNAKNNNKSQGDHKEYTGAQADKIIPGSEFVVLKSNTAFPSTVRFNEGKQISSDNFFNWLSQTINYSRENDFRKIKAENDELGMTHMRFKQYFKGIQVYQSTYTLHSKNGNVNSFNGDAFNLSDALSSTPSLNESRALDAAKHYVGAEKYMWEDSYWENNIKERTKNPAATYFPKGELSWYSTNLKSDKPEFILVYVFDIYASSPNKAQRIVVDASSGKIVNTIPLESNCTSASVNTNFNGSRTIFTDKYTATNYRLRDDCQSATIRIRNWNSATTTASPIEIENTTNTWTTMNERFGGTVLWSAKQSYLYWLNVRGRASYDNSNGSIEGYINAVFACDPPPSPCYYTDNASMSFSGGTLKVGLGSSGTLANSWSALDIIGHEFTHAVTGSSAALDYQDESGALNESFSDIFGEATENYVTGSNDWLMGSDRTNGAIRSMSNPNSFNDPDTYQGTNWYSGTGDNGGVHTNSGVQNHWFYILSQGKSGTNDNGDPYSVTGIGLASASAIASRNLTVYLNSTSGYNDARDGAINAAIDLFGACSNEVRQTTNAWYAVGVGDPFLNATTAVISSYNGRDVSCYGACDGSASVTAANGEGIIKYSWSTGATTSSITNLCAGTYNVTITDNNGSGCTATASVTLVNPPQLTASINKLTNYNGYNVSCNGASDGQAEAIGSGGTTPYSYLWSNGQTTKIALNLSAGTYSVTITDVNGCTATASTTLTEPPALAINAGSNKIVYLGYPDSSCTVLTASGFAGGVPPYSIHWSTGATTNSITVCPGVTTWYKVTISDANGCSATDSAKVCVIDVRCGNGSRKVIICHNGNTLCIDLNGAHSHFLQHHGDQLAACGTVKFCDDSPVRLADNGSEMPIDFDESGVLLNAYPNPLSGVTTIRYTIPDDGRVNISVLDITGKEVSAIYSGEMNGGFVYEKSIDLNFLSDGMYYLVMRSDAGILSEKKLIVAK